MHDLIQDMGEQIVFEESPKYPEKRSRLNDSKEIFDVLKNNTGTKKIQGITVDVAQIKEVRLRVDTFKKMTKLRIIKFYSSYGCYMASHIKLPRDLESFPNNLRYFHWDVYPLESLPLDFCPENLVELHMECNNMKKLWDGLQLIYRCDLPTLEIINLGRSQQLVELPDFSMTRKLKTVYLDFCENLCSIHPSILSNTLVNLDVSYCSRLESLESESHLKSLSDLRVDGCGSLKKFCLSLGKLERLDLWSSKEIEILHLPIIGQFTELRDLYLTGLRLSSLPLNEFLCFKNLERFRLDDFRQVIQKTELEILFAAWHFLKCLCIENCIQLTEIPDNISNLTQLELLSLRGSSVEILPCMQNLSNLQKIIMPNCRMLRSILGLPPNLDTLSAPECTSLETIFFSSGFPQQILDNVCRIEFKKCAKLDEPSLVFAEKMIQPSFVLAAKRFDYRYTACYSRSRVPSWMAHKRTSSTVEFTCNDEQSLMSMVFGCVLPSTPGAPTIFCNYSDANNLRFESHYVAPYIDTGAYNSDHVFIWHHIFGQRDRARASCHGRIIACKFSATCSDDDMELIDSDISIKACGVWPVYASEIKFVLDRKRKRVSHVDDMTRKQKHPKLRLLQNHLP